MDNKKNKPFAAVQRVRAHDLSKMIDACQKDVSKATPRLRALAKSRTVRAVQR